MHPVRCGLTPKTLPKHYLFIITTHGERNHNSPPLAEQSQRAPTHPPNMVWTNPQTPRRSLSLFIANTLPLALDYAMSADIYPILALDPVQHRRPSTSGSTSTHRPAVEPYHQLRDTSPPLCPWMVCPSSCTATHSPSNTGPT